MTAPALDTIVWTDQNWKAGGRYHNIGDAGWYANVFTRCGVCAPVGHGYRLSRLQAQADHRRPCAACWPGGAA